MELELNWAEFRKIEELEYSNESIFKGIYIWGFTINNQFIPYYVGIAENVEYRLTEHINFLLGGKYTIHNKDSLKEFFKYKNEGLKEINQKGMIYIPYWPDGYHNFLKKRKLLNPHLDFMVDTMTFSYAKLDKEGIGKKELLSIEKICINTIGKDRLINSRAGYSNDFTLKHKGNKRIVELLKKDKSPGSR